jgi:hypothetical protein
LHLRRAHTAQPSSLAAQIQKLSYLSRTALHGRASLFIHVFWENKRWIEAAAALLFLVRGMINLLHTRPVCRSNIKTGARLLAPVCAPVNKKWKYIKLLQPYVNICLICFVFHFIGRRWEEGNKGKRVVKSFPRLAKPCLAAAVVLQIPHYNS